MNRSNLLVSGLHVRILPLTERKRCVRIPSFRPAVDLTISECETSEQLLEEMYSDILIGLVSSMVTGLAGWIVQ